MSERETVNSRTSPHARYLKNKLTRREFLEKIAVSSIGIGLLSHYSKNELPFKLSNKKAYQEYEQYVKGYDIISPNEYPELFSYPSKSSIKLDQYEYFPQSEVHYTSFHLPKESLVFANLTGLPNKGISLSIIKAYFQETEYFCPILQTEHFFTSTISFGKLSDGEHTIIFQPLDNADENSVNFRLNYYSPMGSDFYMSVMNNIPLLGMRKDNIQNNTLLNDMPFFSDVVIRKNHYDDKYLVEYWVGYTSEDGGTPPWKLWQDLGRTYDYEALLILMMNKKGEIFESLFQGNRHSFLNNIQRFDVPVKDINAKLQLIGNHGLVDNNLRTNKVFSLVPNFKDERSDFEKSELEYARKIISLREIKNQSEEFLSKIKPDDSSTLSKEIINNGKKYYFAKTKLSELEKGSSRNYK